MARQISNLMRRLRYRWKAKQRAEMVVLQGGPYDGQIALLTCGRGTLHVTVGEWNGRYEQAIWIAEPTNGSCVAR